MQVKLVLLLIGLCAISWQKGIAEGKNDENYDDEEDGGNQLRKYEGPHEMFEEDQDEMDISDEDLDQDPSLAKEEDPAASPFFWRRRSSYRRRRWLGRRRRYGK